MPIGFNMSRRDHKGKSDYQSNAKRVKGHLSISLMEKLDTKLSWNKQIRMSCVRLPSTYHRVLKFPIHDWNGRLKGLE
ncbi:hypothetical protein HAX54_001686, partial [Datura stramonium]|nr:hypothetical protein [Datura stramonium]